MRVLFACLIAVSAIELVAAYSNCDSSQSDQECNKCCIGYGYRQGKQPYPDKCDCFNGDVCDRRQSRASCKDCCEESPYLTFDWDDEEQFCSCGRKGPQTSGRRTQAAVERACPFVEDKDACDKCCHRRDYLDFVWTQDARDCDCRSKQPKVPPSGPCSDADSKYVCEWCCQDRNYASYKWNSAKNVCTCENKNN